MSLSAVWISPTHTYVMMSALNPFSSSQPCTLDSKGNYVSHLFVCSKKNYVPTTTLDIGVQETKCLPCGVYILVEETDNK